MTDPPPARRDIAARRIAPHGELVDMRQRASIVSAPLGQLIEQRD